MAKKTQTPVAADAEAFRGLCQRLIKQRIQSASDKRELADALGCSIATVNALIYQGKGSFETYVAALFWAFNVDTSIVESFLLDSKAYLRKLRTLKPSDRLWFQLDSAMGEEEKSYWARLLRAAKDLELTLGVGKRESRYLKAADRSGG